MRAKLVHTPACAEMIAKYDDVFGIETSRMLNDMSWEICVALLDLICFTMGEGASVKNRADPVTADPLRYWLAREFSSYTEHPSHAVRQA